MGDTADNNIIINMIDNKYCIFAFVIFLILYSYTNLDFSPRRYKNYNGNYDDDVIIVKNNKGKYNSYSDSQYEILKHNLR